MGATLASYAPIYALNQSAAATLSVENIASVLAAAGVDKLDYSVSVTGNLFGSYAGTALGLAAPNLYSIGFDTSTPGLKSGTVFVNSTSLAAEHASFSFPVSFMVSVPEPATLSLLLLGGALVLLVRAEAAAVAQGRAKGCRAEAQK